LGEAGPNALVDVARDELGVIATCSCGRWGYAGLDDAHAHEAFRIHIEEAAKIWRQQP